MYHVSKRGREDVSTCTCAGLKGDVVNRTSASESYPSVEAVYGPLVPLSEENLAADRHESPLGTCSLARPR